MLYVCVSISKYSKERIRFRLTERGESDAEMRETCAILSCVSPESLRRPTYFECCLLAPLCPHACLVPALVVRSRDRERCGSTPFLACRYSLSAGRR